MKRSGSTKSIFLAMILLSGITLAVLAAGATSNSYADGVKVSGLVNPPQDLTPKIVAPDLEQKMARSGCCSWHGGVCDCIGGRIVCCDGTFSPSCTCNRDSNKGLTKSEQ